MYLQVKLENINMDKLETTLCLLKKSLYLCNPNCYEDKIIINNIQQR